MTIPDSIRAKIAELDPAAQTVIELILHMYGEQSLRLQALEAQLATYQRMLFGSRSEKLPPISDAVRRQIEEEEFAEGILGIACHGAAYGNAASAGQGERSGRVNGNA